jgi:hypothetical protein
VAEFLGRHPGEFLLGPGQRARPQVIDHAADPAQLGRGDRLQVLIIQQRHPRQGVGEALEGTREAGQVLAQGGVAILSAMCSREYLSDARQARREGRYPVVDDPGR